MIEKRNDFGIAFDKNKQNIYVLGGIDRSKVEYKFMNELMSSCERYSIKFNKWTQIAEL